MKTIILICFGVTLTFRVTAQADSITTPFSFESDFRFRVEQDRKNRTSESMYLPNRMRYRYRARFGVTYQYQWLNVGLRIRTGNPDKQQDPQLTIGDSFEDIPIVTEKAYMQGQWDDFSVWLGQNTFPFEKNNELFWSDQVFPWGIFLDHSIPIESNLFNHMSIRGGHFYIPSRYNLPEIDSYVQGVQLLIQLLQHRLSLFPSYYLFHQMPNIPDGAESFHMDYRIFHLGSKFTLAYAPMIQFEVDYYKNSQQHQTLPIFPQSLKSQNTGLVIGISFGELKNKGDWFFKPSYAYLERYAAVDFLAQNDWARWDYSSYGSPDGRLTNFRGFELVAGYKIHDKVTLKIKQYQVKQLISTGTSKETSHRFRFDIDVVF